MIAQINIRLCMVASILTPVVWIIDLPSLCALASSAETSWLQLFHALIYSNLPLVDFGMFTLRACRFSS